MIPPKTDWTAEDYFNRDDYNRIRSNLIELAEALEVDTTVYHNGVTTSLIPPEGNYGMPLTQLIRNQILMLCIRIAQAKEWRFPLKAYVDRWTEQADPWSAVVNVPRWFDWQELNTIEQLCVLATADARAAEYGAGHEYGTGGEYGGVGLG